MTAEQSVGWEIHPQTPKTLSYSVLEVLNLFTGHQSTQEENPASPAYLRLELEESSAFFPIHLVKTKEEDGNNASLKIISLF